MPRKNIWEPQENPKKDTNTKLTQADRWGKTHCFGACSTFGTGPKERSARSRQNVHVVIQPDIRPGCVDGLCLGWAWTVSCFTGARITNLLPFFSNPSASKAAKAPAQHDKLAAGLCCNLLPCKTCMRDRVISSFRAAYIMESKYPTTRKLHFRLPNASAQLHATSNCKLQLHVAYTHACKYTCLRLHTHRHMICVHVHAGVLIMHMPMAVTWLVLSTRHFFYLLRRQVALTGLTLLYVGTMI